MLSAKVISVVTLLIALARPGEPAIAQPGPQNSTWQDVKRNGKGAITIYWYESQPFIRRAEGGQMQGIEHDIMEGFKRYVRKTYGVDLTVNWIEADSFADTYNRITDARTDGIFGASAFSITPERQREVDFSPPYMADVCVLITSKNIPIVESTEEFNRVFSGLTAITIQETTYEQDLLKLKTEGKLDFKLEYIPSSHNILRSIEQRDDAFGFIDLPIYLMAFNEDPSINVKRQNLFPVKRQGYAIIYPRGSSWAEPIAAYYDDPGFDRALEAIIGQYIDLDLHHFTERLAIQSTDMVDLLTREKEIQYQDLVDKSEQIEKETRARNFLIALQAVIFVSLVVIIVLYRKRSEQKKKIEAQQKSIAMKNEELEKRNHQLVLLDEEKNNLIRILAHDLRTPINHVYGLAQVLLLSNGALPEDQKSIIQGITDASVRLNKMITNILDLDSIEQNRAKVFIDEVPIAELVTNVVKNFEKQAAKKNISLLARPEMPQSRIKGDPLFLMQVFENLLSNAIKFSEKGKPVEVGVAESAGKVVVSIKDSGPGLTADDMKLIFKKFQRLSAKPTDGEHSTGLGLSIVKQYVELMGGRVWCEPGAGSGATFMVELNKA